MRPPLMLRDMSTWRRIRPQPHRHADCAGRAEGGLLAPPGAHVAQHQRWPHHRLCDGGLNYQIEHHLFPYRRITRYLNINISTSTRSGCAPATVPLPTGRALPGLTPWGCLLYTSDAADEEDSVDLGGRRI